MPPPLGPGLPAGPLGGVAAPAAVPPGPAAAAPLVVVNCDGSCRGSPPAAGFGVFFAVGDERNASVPLGPDELQTQNRAELSAVLHALRVLQHEPNIEVVTDSAYVYNGCVQQLDT